MRDIGKNIRTLRMQKNMTQDMFAEKLFVTRQTVSNYETGRSRPDIEMVIRIAEVLEVDANTVLYGPPIPQSRTAKIKQLVLLLVITFPGIRICLDLIHILFFEDWFHFPDWVYLLFMNPIILLVFGWALMQGLSLFFDIKPLQLSKAKYVRYLLYVILVFNLLLLIPYLVFAVVTLALRINDTSSLPAIVHRTEAMRYFRSFPVYRALSDTAIHLSNNYYYLYALPGIILWLTGFPKHREKQLDRQEKNA